MGQSALEELEGVQQVTKGFQGSKEINTVTYDANLVTPKEMESALKAAGTFVGVAKK